MKLAGEVIVRLVCPVTEQEPPPRSFAAELESEAPPVIRCWICGLPLKVVKEIKREETHASRR